MKAPDYQKGMNDVPPSYDFPVFFYVSSAFTFSKQSNTKCFAVRHVRLKSVLPRSDFLHPVMELGGGGQKMVGFVESYLTWSGKQKFPETVGSFQQCQLTTQQIKQTNISHCRIAVDMDMNCTQLYKFHRGSTSNPSKSPASEASEVFSREGSWNPTKINH